MTLQLFVIYCWGGCCWGGGDGDGEGDGISDDCCWCLGLVVLLLCHIVVEVVILVLIGIVVEVMVIVLIDCCCCCCYCCGNGITVGCYCVGGISAGCCCCCHCYGNCEFSDFYKLAVILVRFSFEWNYTCPNEKVARRCSFFLPFAALIAGNNKSNPISSLFKRLIPPLTPIAIETPLLCFYYILINCFNSTTH